MSLASLPDGLRRMVAEELNAGEQVRWAGRPAVFGRVARSLPTAFFGLFVAGFAAFWMAGAFEMGEKHKEMKQRHADFDRRWNETRDRMDRDPWGAAPPPAPAPVPPPKEDSGFSFHDLFPYFGLLFLTVGLGMLLAPVWAAYKATNTVYVVTDRRAVVFDGGWSTHVRSFGPADLTAVERRQRPDGSGDLILAKEPYWVPGHTSGPPGRGHHVPGGWSVREIGFFGIPRVREVEQLIRNLAPTP
ncbi:MAG: hypothetical protein C0501_22270 [Isosphaera sp.]|nr:hypothetical protein [Isosphaera sp.]